ncbi:hypothetical protein CI105_05835 [Candidatus Izimaplasma bacterium ZiA1]|nr:hypothetical protein CI105_05835 [Candidatus Izimaplasma bacterium ZiA1]
MKGMIDLKILQYYKPTNLEDAYQELLKDDNNLIIGGGAWLRLTNKVINKAIDLELLSNNKIMTTNTDYEIGNLVTLKEVEDHEGLKRLMSGILPKAISKIMGESIRNIATLSGSIMGKYSFSDVITPLLVMNTRLVFYKQGEVSLEDFLHTKKSPKDILLKILIKKEVGTGYFHKVQKTSLDFAVINLAITKGSKIDIAIGARPSIALKPVKAIEYINKAEKIDELIIDETVIHVLNEIKLGSNNRASDEYRKELVKVYLKRGLNEVMTDEN